MNDFDDSAAAVLLRRIGQGDEQALVEIFRAVNRPVFMFAMRLLGDRQDAEEVLNDTALELWHHPERFGGDSGFTACVLGIAHDAACTRLRNKGLSEAQPVSDFEKLVESLRGAGEAAELPEDIGLERVLVAVREAEGTRALPRAGAPGQITQLLANVRAGDTAARDALFALAYGELKKLAHARLYQAGRSNTLDTVGLVHEAYLRFVRSADLRSEDHRSFFAFASQVMRNVIVDTARARLAQRRGAGVRELTLSTQLLEQVSSGEEAILEVHEALLVLEQADPRLAQVVEMRYYGGYTEAEIAETLGVTERTVQRDWNKARLLLHAALHRKG